MLSIIKLTYLESTRNDSQIILPHQTLNSILQFYSFLLLITIKPFKMRKIAMLSALFAFIMIYAASCAKGITPYEAANGKAKCGKYIK